MDITVKNAALDWNPLDTLPDSFLRLPHEIYANDPYWIPENSDSVSNQFSSKNPYFQSNSVWLGNIDGVSRLVGFFDDTNLINGELCCYFGFWETTDSLKHNETLFAELEAWAKQKGAKHIFGPINFSTYQANRLKLDAFDEPSFQGEPRNPSYYPNLLKQLGYHCYYQYHTSISHDLAELSDVLRPGYEKFLKHNHRDIKIGLMTPEIWMDNLDYLYEFIDQAFGNNFGYRKISKQVFNQLCGQPFADKMCPKSSVVATDQEGVIRGFFLGYPNYAELIQNGAENRISESEIHYQRHTDLLSSPKICIAKTVAVDPALRNAHLFSAMSFKITDNARGHYKTIYGAMVRDDNPSSNVSERLPYKRLYGLFSKQLS